MGDKNSIMEVMLVPQKIKFELVVNYLYSDILCHYKRIFGFTKHNIKFQYDIANSLVPRIFENNGIMQDEMVIYDED